MGEVTSNVPDPQSPGFQFGLGAFLQDVKTAVNDNGTQVAALQGELSDFQDARLAAEVAKEAAEAAAVTATERLAGMSTIVDGQVVAVLEDPDSVTAAALKSTYLAQEELAEALTAATPGETVGSVVVDRNGPVLVLDDARHKAFPGLTLTADGTLLGAYREAPTHDVTTGADHGRIIACTSRRAGQSGSWDTASEVLVDDPGELDARDPSLITLTDGTLVLSYFLSSASTARWAYTKRKPVGGSWSAQTSVNSGFTLEEGVTAPPVELDNGDLLLVVYGRNTGDTYYTAKVVRSTDGGATWGSPVVIADGPTDTISYQEPVAVILGDGTLLCLMRTSLDIIYTSTSVDGTTWTAPAAGFAGSGRPAAVTLASGAVVCMYRRTVGPAGTAIGGASEVAYRTTRDGGASWTLQRVLAAGATMVYAAPVEVADNLAAVLYAMESGTQADLYFTYISDGQAASPLGGLTRETIAASADEVLTDATSSRYYPIAQTGTYTTMSIGAGTCLWVPFAVSEPQRWDTVAVGITGAATAGTLRLGILEDNGRGGPGELLVDFGTVAATAVADATLAVNVDLMPGHYFLAVLGEDITGTLTIDAMQGSNPKVGRTLLSEALSGQMSAYSKTGQAAGSLVRHPPTPAVSYKAPNVVYKRSA